MTCIDFAIGIENLRELIGRFRRLSCPAAHFCSSCRICRQFQNGLLKGGRVVGRNDPTHSFFADDLGEFGMGFGEGENRFSRREHVIKSAGNGNPRHAGNKRN